ncbi:MAG: hypothetical protein A3E83_02685 [Gammaproteobacteria bacterium RIFCSPHIGHO2_12_FULL_41_20]|nr:MAG: hypothetical protein A3E83_02685 [Gammaproteobacteria bacterium RIFCSPHIGHO2_12_FULL_41_20]
MGFSHNYSSNLTNGQKLTTAGNATIIAYDGKPVLVTDPWFGDEDPAYFGSWVLSHIIPSELKKDISNAEYVWFSHGHPDHLNSASLEKVKHRKILLPDHVNSRIFNDMSSFGYSVTILPDRKWVQLSKNIKVYCITTFLQDSILLIDICDKLFINLNDSGARDCARHIRSIAKNYKHSYLMTLSGYGDTDMINFFDENGVSVKPEAANKLLIGQQFNIVTKMTGAKSVIPFSSFHKYQRTDSIWAQQYTTPIDAYGLGLNSEIEYIAPFCTIDCNDLSVNHYNPPEYQVEVKEPEVFGDNWSDELNSEDKKEIELYFSRKERIQSYFGFVSFSVGGKAFYLKMRGKPDRGITFSVPRNSLMLAIKYRVFDDLLIGNFMKTTLHNCESLYEGRGNFNFNTAKFGDNGLVETEREIVNYLKIYRKRAGMEFLIGAFEDKSKDFIIRFAGRDSKVFNALKQLKRSVFSAIK